MNENWNNVGDQIKDALQDALDTGDFKQLNSVVAGTVNSALTEAKRQVKIATDSINSGYHGPGGPGAGGPGNPNGGPAGFGGSGGWNGAPGGPGGRNGNAGGPGGPGGRNGNAGGAGGPAGWNGSRPGAGGPGGQAGWNGGPGSAGGAAGGWNAGRPGSNWNGAWNRGSFRYGAWNNGAKKDTFHYKKGSMAGGIYTSQTQRQSGGNAYRERAYNTYRGNMAKPAAGWKNPNLPAVKTRKVGQVSGTLYLVFGGIGTGVMAFALIVIILMLFMSAIQSPWPLMVVGAMLLAFLLMIERGCVKKERLKRAGRYVELCDGKTYINTEELAMHISRSRRFVVRDLRRMLKLGIFPEGHLDEKGACFMLDDATYREYIRLQKERKVQEMEDKMAKMRGNQKQGAASYQEEKAVEAEAAAVEPNVNSELEALIADGQDCIRKLRDMNDAIEGEVISSKLFQLENLLKEIFDRVREHPDQMPQMHKFMDYYLPTTLKLVQAYSEFDSVSVPGEDIVTAKQEIEKTLDTINSAFTELLNNLFRDSVFDVTTDAQVLQTMLAKEGLTREMEMEKVPR